MAGHDKVADVVVRALQDAGAKRCYGIVGDTLNHVSDAIRRSDIDWVHVRHEEAGAFAAGGEALLTGELALCAGSGGPGSLHFINGLYDAHRSHAPVVLIASQIVTDELGFNFPQEVDFRQVYAGCSVYCDQIYSADQAQRKTVLAAQMALSKRGVAVLVLPGDISAQPAEYDSTRRVHRAHPVILPGNDELDRMVELLDAGERVAIYGGSGCADAHDEALALARKLNAPIGHTSRAKDFLEHDNPHDVGMTGVFGNAACAHALQHCDTLLLLGCDFAWSQFYPDDATIIQVDIDGGHLGHRHPVDLGVVGQAKATAAALAARVKHKDDRAFLDDCLQRRAEVVDDRDQKASDERSEKLIHPQHLAEVIDRHATDDAVFTADGGSPMVWTLRHVRTNGRRRTVISLTHGTMACAMPNALGVQKAYPGRQVISMSGDGGLAMLLGDLLTTVQEKLPIKIVVFNNSALGFVEMEMKVEGLLDAYTDLLNPDFSKVAEAIGLWGRRVEQPADLDAAVRDWLSQPGPALLDVKVNRMELVMPARIEPKQVLGTALYSAKAMLDGRGKDVVELIESNTVK